MLYLIFLQALFSFAHIVQDDVTIVNKFPHKFYEVCKQSGYPDSPLIDVVSGTEIDCMGRKVDVSEFCDKSLAADPYYLRAFIDKMKNEVVCITGKKVIFRYQCVKLSDRAICSKNARDSCTDVHKRLARRLELIHASYIRTDKGIKQLDCFFELPSFDKE